MALDGWGGHGAAFFDDAGDSGDADEGAGHQIVEVGMEAPRSMQELGRAPFSSEMLIPWLSRAFDADARAAVQEDSDFRDLVCIATHPGILSIRALTYMAQRGDAAGKARDRRRLAMLCVLLDRFCRSSIERGIAAIPGVELLVYVDLQAWDSTDFTVRVRDGKLAQPSSSMALRDMCPTLALQLGAVDEVREQPSAVQQQARRSQSVSPQKLLQTRSRFAMLVRVGARLIRIIGSSINFLQVLGSGVAELLRDALGMTSAVTPDADKFELKVRLAMVDSDNTNFRADGAVLQAKPGWLSITIKCHLHKTATCHGKTFSLADGRITGVIRFGMSLNVGTAMKTFREALREILLKRATIIRERPSREAVAYRKAVLDLHVSSGPHWRVRQAILVRCLGGDWRRRDVVEILLLPGQNVALEELVAVLADEVVFALLPKEPLVYPRHRWTGADEALSYVDLLMAVHGVAEPTFEHWCATAKFSGQAGARDGAGAGGREGPGGPARDDVVLSAGPSLAGKSPGDMADENSKSRKIALEFLKSPEAPWVTIDRIALGPLCTLLFRYLQLGCQRWRAEQRQAAFAASSAGAYLERLGRCPVAAAASGELEKKFFEEHGQIWFDEAKWQAVHPMAHHLEASCLGFRLMARSRACVTQLLHAMHKEFPWPLFAVLGDPSKADDVLLARHSPILDEFTRAFLAKYPSAAALRSDVAMASLCTIAVNASVDIKELENGNGQMRRRIDAASNQTHTQLLDDASAAWVLFCSRRREFDADRMRGGHSFSQSLRTYEAHRRPHLRDGGPPTKKKKRYKSIGLWRAFCQRHWNECPDFSLLGVRYRGMNDEARKAFAAEVRDHKDDMARWSAPERGYRERRVRALDRAVALRGAVAPAADGLCENWCGPEELALCLDGARQVHRAATAEAQSASRTLQQDLQRCSAAWDRKFSESLREELPWLGSLTDGFIGDPSEIVSCSFEPPLIERACAALKDLRSNYHLNGKMLQHLDEQWRKVSTPLDKSRARARIQGKTVFAGGDSWKEGFDVTTEDGKRVLRLMSFWKVAMLTGRFRAHRPDRELLRNGYLLCRFDSAKNVDGTDTEPTSKFMHVSLMYFSPLRPTWTPLVFVDEDPDTGVCLLEAMPETKLFHEAMRFFVDSQLSWECTWYRVLESREPLPRFSCYAVKASRLPRCIPVQIWPVPRQQRGGRRNHGPGGEAALEDDELPAEDDLDAEEMQELERDLERVMEEEEHEPEADAGDWEDDAAALFGHEDPCRDVIGSVAGAEAGGEPTLTPSEVEDLFADHSSDEDWRAPVEPVPASPAGGPSDEEPADDRCAAAAAPDPGAAVDPEPPSREPAEIRFTLPETSHSIVYYPHTKRFVAVCASHGVGCERQRTAKAPSRLTPHNAGQGRPVGALWAWLVFCPPDTDRAGHMRWKPTTHQRATARLLCATTEGCEVLSERERPCRPDEELEPRRHP